MKALACSLILVIVALSACGPKAPSAEADPLSGRWEGEWGPSPDRQTSVVLELKWDGASLTGVVNPGTRAMNIDKATFDRGTSAITMDMDVVDVRGEMDHYAIKGKVDGKNMTGTWTRNNGTGTFKISKE